MLEVALGYLIALFLPGYCLTKILFPRGCSIDRLELTLLSITLSMGTLSLCMTTLAFLRQLYFINILSMILLFCILCSLIWFRKQVNIPKTLTLEETRDPAPVERPFKWVLLLLMLAIYSMCFYHAVFFPVTSWDALIYHLPVARGLYQEHSIPDIGILSGYPMLVPMIYSWFFFVTSSTNDLYIRTLPPILGMVSLLEVTIISRSFFNRRSAFYSCFILAAMPIHMTVS